jgi:hypothetical protein
VTEGTSSKNAREPVYQRPASWRTSIGHVSLWVLDKLNEKTELAVEFRADYNEVFRHVNYTKRSRVFLSYHIMLKLRLIELRLSGDKQFRSLRYEDKYPEVTLVRIGHDPDFPKRVKPGLQVLFHARIYRAKGSVFGLSGPIFRIELDENATFIVDEEVQRV